MAERGLGLDADCRGVIERLLEQLFDCQDIQPKDQDELPIGEKQCLSVQLVVSQIVFLSSQTVRATCWTGNRVLGTVRVSSVLLFIQSSSF